MVQSFGGNEQETIEIAKVAASRQLGLSCATQASVAKLFGVSLGMVQYAVQHESEIRGSGQSKVLLKLCHVKVDQKYGAINGSFINSWEFL